MSDKDFDILAYTTENEILSRLEYIGNQKLTITGHGFETFGAIPIRESAEKSTSTYTDKNKEKPALGLIDVVLAANRNYNKVVRPNLDTIEASYPDLKTFQELSEIIETKTQEEFYSFWGHRDEKKYKTLKNLLAKTKILRELYPTAKDDYDLMNLWGQDADLFNYEQDIIGSIPNIAVATFQHLRMVYGVNTIKPDQRVKEVLDYEFGLSKLADEKVIKAVEQIATIAKMKVIAIDQILVQYGSSYYNQSANKVTIKQIVRNLKELGVDNETISKATLLTLGQIERLK
jgi:hypothetical protein